jgi:hypothetical protein
VQNLRTVTQFQSTILISEPTEKFTDSGLCTGLLGGILDCGRLGFFREICYSFDEVLFGFKMVFGLDFLEVDLGELLFMRVSKFHFDNESGKGVVIIVEMNVLLPVPVELLSQGPGKASISGTLISDKDLESDMLKLGDFADFFLVNERKLVDLELIFVFNNTQVVSITLKKVNGRVDLLILVHVLNLNHKHEPINVNSLFA